MREISDRRRSPVLAGLLLVACAGAASAQGGWDFGLRAGVYLDDYDPFVGAEALTRIGDTRWFVNPNVEVVFPDRGDLFTLNGDVHYQLGVDAPLRAWVGAGLAIVLRDSDRGRGDQDDETDPGLNLLGGVGFLEGQAVRPYVQGKVLLSNQSEAVLAFGVRF